MGVDNTGKDGRYVWKSDKPIPSFSIVMPTWGEHEGLRRSLANIIYQSFPEAKREVLVVGDGYEKEAEEIVKAAQQVANLEKQDIKIWYLHLKHHVGDGNIPRAFGLDRATADWILFIDAGTCVTHNAFQVLSNATDEYAEARLMTWDMVQQLDPVPFVTNASAILHCDRTKGLPYVLPGCATAVRREDAQKVEWPALTGTPTDWVYFSRLWQSMYIKDGIEAEERIDKEVVIIPLVLTIAYSARVSRKWRLPMTVEQFDEMGWNMGHEHAATAGVVEVIDGRQTADTEPVS